jgi:hypothetical protein
MFDLEWYWGNKLSPKIKEYVFTINCSSLGTELGSALGNGLGNRFGMEFCQRPVTVEVVILHEDAKMFSFST